jgi:hypothetical protein
MLRAEGLFINGLTACALSLLIWRSTHNFWGWLVMATPGAILILAGWWVALRARD